MVVTLNSYDICVPGFERLREQSEFMLVVPVGPTDNRGYVYHALLADLTCCDRGDGFDYFGAKAMLKEAFGNPDKLGELFDASLEPVPEDGEGCNLYLYCEESKDG